jgi:hypothetical protein
LSAVGTFVDERPPGIDASTGPSLPPSLDATVDADLGDVSSDVVIDAPVDGSADVVVDVAPDGPLTFCQMLSPAPTFCADFDGPAQTDPAAEWTSSIVGAGSTLTLVQNPFLSSPRSLRAQTTAGNESSVVRSFSMTTTISIEFEVRFAALPADGTALSPFMLTPPTFPGFDLYWFVDANNAYFQEYGDDLSPSQPQPSTTAFHKVLLSVTTNGTSSTIDASVDGTAYWTNHVMKYPWPMMTTATLHVGAARAYATNNDVFIDNVVVKTN